MTNSDQIQKKIAEDYWVSKFLSVKENRPKPTGSHKKSKVQHFIQLSADAQSIVEEMGKGNEHAKYVLFLACYGILMNRFFPDMSQWVKTPRSVSYTHLTLPTIA